MLPPRAHVHNPPAVILSVGAMIPFPPSPFRPVIPIRRVVAAADDRVRTRHLRPAALIESLFPTAGGIARGAVGLAGARVAFAIGAEPGGDDAVYGAEKWTEGDEAGAEDAKEELGGGPPDDGHQCVCEDFVILAFLDQSGERKREAEPTRNIVSADLVEKHQAGDARHQGQCTHAQNGRQPEFLRPIHVEPPNDGDWKDEEEGVGGDVECSVGDIELDKINTTVGRNGSIPIGTDGDVEKRVDDDCAEHVAAEDCDEKPADVSKPSLNEDAVVE
ncbi:MAG: hypothetical protein Q9211_003452 [Gyalolechia sp. 1 TL-2023]